MPGIKNFEDFYTIKVQPNIERFKQEDKGADKWGIIMTVAIVATVVSFILNIESDVEWNGTFITVVLLLLAVYSVYNYTQKDNAYIDDFKQNLVKEIIDYLHPGLNYIPDGMIPEKEYRQSGLYRWRYDYFEGDDYIEGVYKGVSFHCSEIRTYKNRDSSTYSAYDEARGIDRDGDIYKGLFFAASVNSAYTGGTYIWIRGKEQLGNSLADEEYRMLRFPRTVRIATGNAPFDQYYSVYSTNPAEAHSILDNEMMENIVRFRKQVQRNVVLSVVMGKCYVAIPVKEDLFEPTDNPENKEEIKAYFFSVLLILSIINQLNLPRLQ